MKPAKDFWNDIRKDLQDRRGLKNVLRFALVFSASFLIFLLAIIPFAAPFWGWAGGVHAQVAHGVLSTWGVESAVDGNVITMEVRGQDVDFVVSQICSGDVEIALLVSLLIASFDILLIWRVLGSILGAGMLLALNPVRIAATLVITKGSGMEAGDVYHTVIFRLFLFVVLVLYYFAWYRTFADRSSRMQERLCKRLGL